MKLEGPVRIKEERASGAKKAFTLLVAVVLAISVYVLLQEVFFVRELLLLVACAARLAFFAANLVLLGILFHAAGRSIAQCFRKPRMGPQEESGSQPLARRISDNRRCRQDWAALSAQDRTVWFAG